MEEGQPPDVLQEQQQKQQQALLLDVLFEATIEKEHFGDHVLEVICSNETPHNAHLGPAHVPCNF
jgi:hypothetical protein